MYNASHFSKPHSSIFVIYLANINIVSKFVALSVYDGKQGAGYYSY